MKIPALDHFSHHQVKYFLQAVRQIRKLRDILFSGIFLILQELARFPQYQFEMVRPGIGMYGVGHFEGLNL